VSEERLKDFLAAEVTHFGAMPRPSLTLEDLISCASCPQHTARFVHEEITKRFAGRLAIIQEIDAWERHSELQEMHECYMLSFQEVRMSELADDLEDFTDTIRRLKQRQKKVLPLLGTSMYRERRERRGLRGAPNIIFTQAWLDDFFRARMATEMLTSQYLAVVEQMQSGSENQEITGIVDPACDPAAICRRAAAKAKQLCEEQTGLTPEIEIEVRSKISTSFSFIPMYLENILLELLKNSCAALAKRACLSTSVADPEAWLDLKPISIVICSNDHNFAIRIRDQTGGIPFELDENVWEYFFSDGDLPTDYGGIDYDGTAESLQGHGLGLPLSRLYARYLGGDLSLVSLPAYGVDTHLHLPRIDMGHVPLHQAVSSSQEAGTSAQQETLQAERQLESLLKQLAETKEKLEEQKKSI